MFKISNFKCNILILLKVNHDFNTLKNVQVQSERIFTILFSACIRNSIPRGPLLRNWDNLQNSRGAKCSLFTWSWKFRGGHGPPGPPSYAGAVYKTTICKTTIFKTAIFKTAICENCYLIWFISGLFAIKFLTAMCDHLAVPGKLLASFGPVFA